MSTSQALDIRLLLIMLITAQGTTPKYSSIADPALHGADPHVRLRIQSSMTKPSLAILASAGSGMPAVSA